MTYLNSTMRQQFTGVGGGYGFGSSYGAGSASSNSLQAYEAQLADYVSYCKSLLQQTQQGSQNYQIIMQDINKAYEYLNMVDPGATLPGGEDLSGAYPSGDAAGGLDGSQGQAGPSFPISWQDATKIVTDEGTDFNYTVSQSDPEKRTIEAYQGTGTIVIPSNSAQVKISQKNDEQGKPMKVVTITYPDGTTKTINFHGKDLTIQAANKDNVVQDASVTGGVTVSEMGEDSTSDVQGDAPTTRRDGKLGYDGDSFDIYSREDGKTKYISARGTVSLHASSNTEYWTVAWDDTKKQYVIKVYDDATQTNVKETFLVDDMTNLKVSFDIDPTHIQFLGELAGGTTGGGVVPRPGIRPGAGDGNTGSPSPTPRASNQPSATDVHGKKLSLVAGDGTTTDNTTGIDPMSTQPDKNENGKATYNTQQDVDLYSFFEDGYIKNYDITAPGTVQIHKTNYSDTALITKNSDGTYTILVTSGEDPTKKITYTVKGPPSNLELDFLPSSVTYKSSPSAAAKAYTPGMDPKIKVAGEEDLEGNTGVNPNGTEPSGVEGNTAYYNNPQNTSLTMTPNFDDTVTRNEITTAGDLTINTTSTTDEVNIIKNGDGTYTIDVLKNGDATKTETYVVSGPPSKIKINALPSKVKYNGNTYTAGVDSKISVSGEENALTWPAKGTLARNVPINGDDEDSGNDGRAKTLANELDKAMDDPNYDLDNFWNCISGDAKDEDEINDIVRKVMTALYKAAGNNDEKFMGLLKMIPAEIRTSMAQRVLQSSSETREKKGGDQWNSQECADLLNDSLN